MFSKLYEGAWALGGRDCKTRSLINPAAAGPPRHPTAAGGGGHKVAPFTSAMISS